MQCLHSLRIVRTWALLISKFFPSNFKGQTSTWCQYLISCISPVSGVQNSDSYDNFIRHPPLIKRSALLKPRIWILMWNVAGGAYISSATLHLCFPVAHIKEILCVWKHWIPWGQKGGSHMYSHVLLWQHLLVIGNVSVKRLVPSTLWFVIHSGSWD